MQDYTKEYNALSAFQIEGEVQSIEPYGEGHINSTFLVKTTGKNYILQKINTVVFEKPENVMNNIVLVTEFMAKKGKLSLCVVKSNDNEPMYTAEDGCYRVYDFIEDSVTYQQAESIEIFKNAGYAFGEFQNTLSDFDASLLFETIEHFHDTPKRFNDFKKALENNKSGRKDTCSDEINFVLERENTYGEIVKALAEKRIPLRVTHNDTKLNNILMDGETKMGKAVIDLDTVMPGSMLYDFGDSIRFGASTAAEDEKVLSKVKFDINLFRAYAEGFLSAVKDSITEEEKKLVSYSAYLMTMECGMRFLADYIDGDTYFATKYPEHNLVRCRTQFKLAKEMQEQMNEMDKIVDKLLGCSVTQ